MTKAREILRLKHEIGLSARKIAYSCNCGKSTVSDILDRAAKAGVSWPIEMNDKKLLRLLYPPKESASSPPEPDVEYIFHEMKKKHVTLMLLWEEYKEAHPDGLMYTQYCERYRQFKKSNKLSYHKEHKGGEEIEVDWAGSTIPYIDRYTGEIKEAYLFASVLPASSYPFAYVYSNMKTPSWIDAHVRAFEFFGGVPRITIPDNAKTAVIETDRFDPVLNKTYHEMARHYRTTVIPARAGKPKDKAADENNVLIVSRRIIAALRNRRFFSVAEINAAVRIELEKLIERPFQKIQGNRRTAFEAIDKPCLLPLPKTRYEYSEWKEARIQFNYHVEYKGFFYSVDYAYIGKKCSVRATSKTIEIYIDNERIAAHPRNHNIQRRYITLPEHMPENHKAVSGWSTERFLSWAEKTGPNTRRFIDHILKSRDYPVQTYRTCMGIMRLAKNHPKKIMEAACREAYDSNTTSYKYFNMILKKTAARSTSQKTETVVFNDNVRGMNSYEGGGINAQ